MAVSFSRVYACPSREYSVVFIAKFITSFHKNISVKNADLSDSVRQLKANSYELTESGNHIIKKYNDGTMSISGIYKGTNTYITNPAGQLFESNTVRITFPQKFIKTAVVEICAVSEKIVIPRLVNSGDNINNFDVRLLSVADYSGINVTLLWTATGKWS